MNLELIRQILMDLNDFMLREGVDIEYNLLRNKLQLLQRNLSKGQPKTRIRGLLIRLSKMNKKYLLVRVMDVLHYLTNKFKFQIEPPRLKLLRLIKPLDILVWTSDNNYPLKLEYT
jgi:hypothetical protein